MSEPIYKYKINRWDVGIDKVEIVRETDKSVWLKDRFGKARRETKTSYYCVYCDTWKEAYAKLLDRAESSIDSKKSSLEYAKQKLKEVLALEEP